MVRSAFAQDKIGNFPLKGDPVFGFNVPQTGPYADEGADELRAYKLAIQHINEGGGMLATMKPSALKGDGLLGKKVKDVTGDTQTNPDSARASARRMIERDGVIMFTGGSSSATAIGQQYLAQERGVICMDGLTHSNDTTGKDKRRYGIRHFFNAYMTGEALAPILAKNYGKDRHTFHLTADYTWGHTQYQSIKKFTEALGKGQIVAGQAIGAGRDRQRPRTQGFVGQARHQRAVDASGKRRHGAPQPRQMGLQGAVLLLHPGRKRQSPQGLRRGGVGARGRIGVGTEGAHGGSRDRRGHTGQRRSERAVILDDRTVVFEGSAQEVLDNQELRREYLAI